MDEMLSNAIRVVSVTELRESYNLAMRDPFSMSGMQLDKTALYLVLVASLHDFDRSPFIVHASYALQENGLYRLCVVLLNPRNLDNLMRWPTFDQHHRNVLLPGKRERIARDIPRLFEDLLRQFIRRSCDQMALAADLRQMATLAIDLGDSNVLSRCMILCHGYNEVPAAREVLERLRSYSETLLQERREAAVPQIRSQVPVASSWFNTPSATFDNFVCIRCGAVSHGSSDACRCLSRDHDGPDSPFGPDWRGRGESFRVSSFASSTSQMSSASAANSRTGRIGVSTRHIDDRKMFSCAAVRVPSEFVSSLSFARTHTVLTFDTTVDENARRETYRLSSFEPFQFNATPLARSGFFHLGFTDAVRCFSCHVVVADWQNSRLGLSRWHLASCLHNRNLPTANRSIESFMSPSRPMTQRPCQRCLRLRATVAFQPCGHLCFCSRCAGAPDIPTRCPRCGIAVSRPAFKP